MEPQLTEVLRFFDLGKPTDYRRAGGFANENYFVTSDKGEFVVKILREHAASNVYSELPYLKKISEHHFPSVTYMSNSSGVCVYESEDMAAVVMRKVEGGPPERSHSTNATMGNVLAKLHTIPSEGLEPRTSYLGEGFMEGAISELKQSVPSEDIQPYVEALSRLDAFKRSLPDKVSRIIHCDFTPNNCLFKKDSLIAVIDWEEVTLGYPLLDLANAILSTCFTDTRFDKTMSDALLNAYFDENDWGELDLSDLAQAIRFAGLTFSLWVYRRWGIDSAEPFIVGNRQLYWRYDLDRVESHL